MKKRTVSAISAIVLVLTLLLTLSACGGSKTIVGAWGYEGGDTFVYHLNEDGSGDYCGTMKLHYTEENGKVTITYDDSGSSLEGTWAEDTLTVKDSLGNDVVYKRK